MKFLPVILTHVWCRLCRRPHIVGSGHYANRFCWSLCVCIVSPYVGLYQRLARPDILSLHTIWYWQFNF